MAKLETLNRSLKLIRVDDTRISYFEGLWDVPWGITYNTYLLLTSEGAVLFDGVRREYAEDHIEAIRSITDLKDIKLIVVHHSEPDHSGDIKLLADLTRAEVRAHPSAARILANYGVQAKPLSDGEELTIGEYKLKTIWTPWLHWPDTIMTWIPQASVLLTGDAFGAYGVPPAAKSSQLSSTEWSHYKHLMRVYYHTVVGHYREWTRKALNKLQAEGIKPEALAPLHGLILEKEHISEALHLYAELAESKPKQKKATIIYVTAYGAAEEAALEAASKLKENGYEVKIHGWSSYKQANLSEAVSDAAESQTVILVAPTYEATLHPKAQHILELLAAKALHNPKQRLVIALEYLWAPTTKPLQETLKALKIKAKHEIITAPAPQLREALISALKRLTGEIA